MSKSNVAKAPLHLTASVEGVSSVYCYGRHKGMIYEPVRGGRVVSEGFLAVPNNGPERHFAALDKAIGYIMASA